MKKRKKIYCPYCGAEAKLRPSSVVYKENTLKDGFLFVCDRYPKCDAYVAAHADSRLPMGTLANGDLRHKRIEAHKVFGKLWQSGLMSKHDAYIWMQSKFALGREQAHIAMFSEYMCDKLIEACNEIYERLGIAS